MAAQHSTYIGAIFGRIEIVGSPVLGQNRRWYVQTRCACGVLKSIICKNIMSGHTVSCGCYGRGMPRPGRRTHGQCHTGAWRSYYAMKTRCTNEKSPAYSNYGGRGIKVCVRWLECFENFLADMGQRPKGCTLDRLNVDGDYEPANCRWATMDQQANNKRDTHYLSFRGDRKSVTQWARKTGIAAATIDVRLALGWSIEKALTEPTVLGSNQFNGGVPVPYKGETRTWSEWAEITKVPYGTLKKRMESGWSLERTLSEPKRPHYRK